MTYLVYPGALHTRFHHALGALYLMGEALETLREKGHAISEEESQAACMAILLHDIGHSPFSHALEHSLVSDISHEDFSLAFMERINEEMKGALTIAISIFKGTYPKKFLHQLVSSQLDMDRIDYLKRDSFFTGVSEGIISHDRIIKMLNVFNDQLVVELKGIYSIEKFIIARRLMYWQVYFHKTVLSAEQMLVKILQRARYLFMNGHSLFVTPALRIFLENRYSLSDFKNQPSLLDFYAALDDYDIFTSLKMWTSDTDPVLSSLCIGIVNRRLYKCILQAQAFDELRIQELQECAKSRMGIPSDEIGYYVFTGSIANNAYDPKDERINILLKDNQVKDIAEASDQLNISVLSGPVIKNFLCLHPMLA